MTGSTQISFDFQKPQPGYSYETSLPAYEEIKATVKETHCEWILSLIRDGARTIKELAKKTGLPDSSVAGRVNNLIAEGKVEYTGYVEYDGRKRKQIGLVTNRL
jgi:predicted transcriptional regulator